MRLAVTVFAMVGFLTVLSGCGSDPVEETIGKIFSQANAAISKLESATDKLNTAANTGKSKKLTKKELKPVLDELIELRGVGKELLSLRAKATALAEEKNLTAEQKQELASKHRGTLRQAFEDVGKAQEKLEVAAAKVLALPEDKLSAKARKELETELRRYRQEFEVLTRSQ